MEVLEQIKKLGNVPFGHDALGGILHAYRSPNDKISALLAGNDILAIKRGLYILADRHRQGAVSRELVSNLLYGPSYVSLDFALAWHGMIPESVNEVTAITTKRAKLYDTPLGRFSYAQSFNPLYTIGIQIEKNPDGTAFLIASKEKALCDKIVFTPKLDIYSKATMAVFLEQSLRIDLDLLNGFSLQVIESCLKAGRKARQLQALYTLIKQIQCR